MKGLYKFWRIIAIGAMIAAATALAGCDNGLPDSRSNNNTNSGNTNTGGGSSRGCKGDGACYYIIANDDYKWCGDASCNVWKGEADTGQATISCNCK
jgi:hypothetical protein